MPDYGKKSKYTRAEIDSFLDRLAPGGPIDSEMAYGLHGVNLLDNADFRNPINQRGQQKYNGITYGIDRWKQTNISAATAEVVADGYKLMANSESYNAFFRQYFENPLPPATYTVSILSKDVVGVNYTQCSGDGFLSTALKIKNGLATETFEAKAPITNALIQIQKTLDASVTVIAAKLEIGDRQTLAHQTADGSWVLNDPPPDQALELAKCQRYYLNLEYETPFVGRTYSGGDENVIITIPTPVTMRTVPTFIGDISNLIVYSEGKSYNPSAINVITRRNHAITLDVKVPTGIGVKKCVAASFTTKTQNALSADL